MHTIKQGYKTCQTILAYIHTNAYSLVQGGCTHNTQSPKLSCEIYTVL